MYAMLIDSINIISQKQRDTDVKPFSVPSFLFVSIPKKFVWFVLFKATKGLFCLLKRAFSSPSLLTVLMIWLFCRGLWSYHHELSNRIGLLMFEVFQRLNILLNWIFFIPSFIFCFSFLIIVFFFNIPIVHKQ